MRKTLTLDDDILNKAAERAKALNISLGKAVSDLVRRGLQAGPPLKHINGLVVFDPPKGSPKIAMSKVRDVSSDFR